MAQELYTVRTFGGLNRNDQLIIPMGIPNPPLSRCENFIGKEDINAARSSYYSSTPIVGMIMKSEAYATFATMPAVREGKGLWQFVPNVTSIETSNFLMSYGYEATGGTSTLYAYDYVNNLWYTLYTGATYYHADAAVYNGKIYITADGKILKWNGDTTNWNDIAPVICDKSGTQTALTGTVTFVAGSDDVVGVGTNFNPEVLRGYWIRIDLTGTGTYSGWYEVEKVTDDTHLTLTTTVAAADAEAGKNPFRAALLSETYPLVLPWFVRFWKNKMWLCGNGDTLMWSVTGDPEDHSTTLGGGYLDLSLLDQEGVSGIEFLDDNAFIFYDFHYEVYRWTGDIDSPIELVRSFPHGCISHFTLQVTPKGIVYFSPEGLRITNGSDDVMLSGTMNNFFRGDASERLMRTWGYYLGENASRYLPWSMYNFQTGVYSLHFPHVGYHLSECINYDIEKMIFLGQDYYHDDVRGCNFYPGAAHAPWLLTQNSGPAGNAIIAKRGMAALYSGDVSKAGVLESPTFCSGVLNKKLKIHWVEFEFHPIDGNTSTLGVNTTVSFNYRKDLGAIDTAIAQTHSIVAAPTAGRLTTRYIREVKRFPLSVICDTFSWQLAETTMSGDDDISILGWSICYELMDSV